MPPVDACEEKQIRIEEQLKSLRERVEAQAKDHKERIERIEAHHSKFISVMSQKLNDLYSSIHKIELAISENAGKNRVIFAIIAFTATLIAGAFQQYVNK